jgi:hypothetical protein
VPDPFTLVQHFRAYMIDALIFTYHRRRPQQKYRKATLPTQIDPAQDRLDLSRREERRSFLHVLFYVPFPLLRSLPLFEAWKLGGQRGRRYLLLIRVLQLHPHAYPTSGKTYGGGHS